MGATGHVSTKLGPCTSRGSDEAKLLRKWYFRPRTPCAGWVGTQEALQGVGASPAEALRTMSFPGMSAHQSGLGWGDRAGAEGGLMSQHEGPCIIRLMSSG